MMTIEEFSEKWRGKRASVIGIGISNRPLIDFLLSAGLLVTARDKKTKDEIGEAAEELLAKGVRLVLGEKYLDGIDEDVIFRTPGMRYDHPALSAAVERGAYLTSEMQLFFELCPAHIIGITGSDGKTTTTTVVSKMLEADGKRVFVGGNIGRPLLPLVSEMTENDFAVVELSSFQLHTMTLSPHRALITNISENHLDYHKGMEEYVFAKLNILRGEDCSLAVLNAANKYTPLAIESTRAGIITFSCYTDADIYERAGAIYKGEEKILDISDIKIPGKHNVENYMAAIALLDGLVSKESIVKVAREFGGVDHRCSLVRVLDGVTYYNSSIDSSPARTVACLSAFDKRVIAICGGYDKNLDYAPLAPTLAEKAKAVIITGATAEKIKKALTEYQADEKPPIYEAENIKEAVRIASEISTHGDKVVLTPASASFDAFKNFEERGRYYCDCVNSL